MKRAAVQQGLVHHDPDVDAIYRFWNNSFSLKNSKIFRLLHADSKNGLNLQFNKFAPPITLSVGSYSPWNSQNTLFHKSAFHTLFLPTTVSFRFRNLSFKYKNSTLSFPEQLIFGGLLFLRKFFTYPDWLFHLFQLTLFSSEMLITIWKISRTRSKFMKILEGWLTIYTTGNVLLKTLSR